MEMKRQHHENEKVILDYVFFPNKMLRSLLYLKRDIMKQYDNHRISDEINSMISGT